MYRFGFVLVTGTLKILQTFNIFEMFVDKFNLQKNIKLKNSDGSRVGTIHQYINASRYRLY